MGAGPHGGARARLRSRLLAHLPPLVGSALLLVGGMDWVVSWNRLTGGDSSVWRTPPDLWATYYASLQVVHGHVEGIYSATTGLVTFPGIVYLLTPVAALGSALHLELGPDIGPYFAPSGWLALGPFVMAVSSIVLFATDAVAARLGATSPRRMALSLVETVLVADVSVWWGHPEDAISVALVLFAVLGAGDERWVRAAFWLGAAIALQPLALLAVPAVMARVPRAYIAQVLAGLVLPSAAVLAPSLVTEWHGTVTTLFDQVNYPLFNHRTPWTGLARPVGSAGGVEAGPLRAVVVVVAGFAGAVVCRRRAGLEVVLWMVALAMTLRVLAEPVLDGYYTWPAITIVVLLAAVRSRGVALAACALSIFLTWLGSAHWSGVWPWWGAVSASLVVCLLLTAPVGDLRSAGRRTPERPPSTLLPPGRRQ